MSVSTIRLMTLATAVALLGCGGAESQTLDTNSGSPAPQVGATGSGTLLWNTDRWGFDGADCAFGGETEPRGSRTLVAVIEDGDRQIFIEAGRSAKREGSITHSLTIAFPEPGRPPAYAPTYFINHIWRAGSGWIDHRDQPVDGPLFVIEGTRLSTPRVEFEDSQTGETAATVQLTAQCAR